MRYRKDWMTSSSSSTYCVPWYIWISILRTPLRTESINNHDSTDVYRFKEIVILRNLIKVLHAKILHELLSVENLSDQVQTFWPHQRRMKTAGNDWILLTTSWIIITSCILNADAWGTVSITLYRPFPPHLYMTLIIM